MKKLHIGSGKDYRKGFINLDHPKAPVKCDIRHDLNKTPYPFKKSEFDHIIAFNIIEHLDNIPDIISELVRISKNNAIIEIIVPHFTCADVAVDLQHRRGYSYFSFDDYEYLGYKVLYRKINFPIRRKFMELFANKLPGFYEHNMAFLFQASTVYYKLQVKK
ncbi:methyltransferase domain-containing protein [Candidatus Woesearchaeota archaeon]|nr:methyltransferase domain-containing protein [Candidatus Woesearchaeota archaeon]